MAGVKFRDLLLLIIVLLLVLGPNIYFTIIGAEEVSKNHASEDKTVCQQESNPVGLGNWLMIAGAAGLLPFGLVLLIVLMIMLSLVPGFIIVGGPVIVVALVLAVIVAMFGTFFSLAWTGVGGAVLWNTKDKCKDKEPMLWNSALAAFIVGILGIFINIAVGFYMSKNVHWP